MKKVLAWAVALALVLSSFTMAFADQAKTSADFKDASQIQYTEAVDVMVATGIINGYPDGTFGPQKTVKRSEMAKMIACIMNGGEDVGDQYKSACPFADSKDHWAAGYIAYCAAEHIIDGRSADVFDPEAEVTGTEVAKMALTSLGYDSKIQGYTGENWAANVLKDAKKNKLFDGLNSDFVPGNPCSREAAAQILFNMLKAPMVEYDTNTSVSVGDATVAVNSKASKVTPEDSGVKDDNKDGYTNLYEDVFGGDLSQKVQDADDFARPAHSWTYEKDDVGTYSDSADYEFTAEKAGLAKAIEAYDEDLSKDIKDYTVTVKVNGQEAADADVVLGDKVELYVTEPVDATEGEGEDEGTPAKPGTVLAIVTQYTPALIETVDTDVSDEDAENGITAYIEFKDKSALDKADSDMAGYDESTYVEGAMIAVAMGKDEKGEDTVLDSFVMEEAAKGEVTKVAKGKYTIDGTAYEVAGDTYVAFDKDVVAEKDTVYVLYDCNGYVLASTVEEEAASEEFYGVAIAFGEKANAEYWSDAESNYTYMAKIFTAEGKAEVFTVNKDVEVTGEPHQFALITYTLNEDGEIDSMAVAEGPTFTDKKLTAGGTLNGYTVAEDVAVFYTPYEPKTDAEGYDYDVEEWAVYEYKDLEGVEKISADASILNDDSEFVALHLEKDLVEAETETVFGFVSGVEEYTTTDGSFATITLWQEGKEVDYDTAKDVYTESLASDLEGFAADTLVMATLDADGNVSAIAEVDQFDYVGAPVDEFEKDAAMYDVEETDCDAEAIIDGYTLVSAATKTALTFGEEQIDKQNISKAVVYFLEDEALSVSSAGKIKPANNAAVKIYQVDAESGVWNIVVFQNVKMPL